jgi:hypothetical protein
MMMLGTTPAGNVYTFAEYQTMFRNTGYASSELHLLKKSAAFRHRKQGVGPGKQHPDNYVPMGHCRLNSRNTPDCGASLPEHGFNECQRNAKRSIRREARDTLDAFRLRDDTAREEFRSNPERDWTNPPALKPTHSTTPGASGCTSLDTCF